MANPGRPIISRAPSSPTFYQVRGTPSDNSHSNSVGVIYPLFFVGAVIIAMVLFYVRGNQAQGIQQLVVTPDYNAVLDLIPNTTQRLLAQASGSYTPSGASA